MTSKTESKSKHKDDNNKDNPHTTDDLKTLGIDESDRNHYAQLMADGHTTEDAKATLKAAKAHGKVKSTGAIGGATDEDVDYVREGSNDLAYKGINPTEAELETGDRKPAGKDNKHSNKKDS